MDCHLPYLLERFIATQNFLQEANIKVPDNYDEFLDAIKAFKKIGITPILAGEKDTWTGMLYYDILALREGGIDGDTDTSYGC